jgi:hypothetical protein
MAAISKEKLVAMEAAAGLAEDGLTYQQRLSRIAAIQSGKPWAMPQSAEPKRGTIEQPPVATRKVTPFEQHPFFGKRLLITPLMTSDKNRALYFDEKIGPNVEVEEVSAGALLYGSSDEAARVSADYKITRVDPSQIVTAKTSIPKTGQEISWEIGKELCPVVRGNDGQRGYMWILPTHMRQYGETLIQILGLKTIITQLYPELLPKFSGKPVMMYIDGFVLAASIPQTEAILKEQRRKELQDDKLGLT